MDDTSRKDGTATFDATEFAGEEIHTYVAFIAADKSRSSDSVYTGKLTLEKMEEA